MGQAKYQVGDVVQLEEKVIEIVEVSPFDSYKVKYIKSPYQFDIGVERYVMKYVIDELYTLVEKREYPNTTGCECGAHKLGYIKPSRSHSSWCVLYKE
jgi:hypothetical protein